MNEFELVTYFCILWDASCVNLVVELSNSFSSPILHKINNKMNILFPLLNQFKIFLLDWDFIFESENFFTFNDIFIIFFLPIILRFLEFLLAVVIVNFKIIKSFLLLIISSFQVFKFLLIFIDRHQKSPISLFSRKKFMNHLLNVRVACACSDFLETLFNIVVLFHLVIHFSF